MKNKLKKILSVLIIITMTFTSSGIVTFANAELETETTAEETSVGANCVSPEDETTVEEATAETSIEEEIEEAEEETEEENTEKEAEENIKQEPETEIETETKTKTESEPETELEPEIETESETETEETSIEEDSESEAGTETETETEIETEINESEVVDIEVEEEQDEVVKDIEYKANPNIRFNFTTYIAGLDTDSQYVLYGSAITNNPDYETQGGSSFRNKNVGDTITAPTVVVNSTEASKGLTFRHWKSMNGTIINSGANRTLTDSDFSYPNYYACFTDNRHKVTMKMYGESASNGSLNTSISGWVTENGDTIRKSALNDEAIGYLKNNVLKCNPGYGFDCFVNASGTTVDPLTWNRNSDATYYIKLKNVGTPVSFNLSGLASVDEQVVNAGEKVTKPDDPVVTGYAFKGWYKEDTYTTAWDFSTDTVGSDPVVIYGKFEENEYNVTLNINDGSYVSPYTAPTKRKYTESGTLPTSANVEKTGYTFGGWYENADFSGSAVTNIAANTAEDKIFYLKWIEKEYSITLNNNGGTYEGGYTAPTTRLYSSATILPTNANITKTGYTFVGWYANAEFLGSAVTSITANTAEDKTYYLKWNENEYNVSVNLNGGSYTNGYTLTNTKRKYSESFTLPTNANVEKLGHTFGGWYENSEFTGSALTTINANTASDKTVYAKWTANEYNITFNLNGGSIKSGNITKYTYGEGATLPNDVEGLSDLEQFAGWYEQSDFSGARVYTISKTDMGDKEYFAKYGKVYKVSFDPGEGEGSMDTVSVEEGKTYNAPACTFTHATLVFDKWQGSDGKIYNKNASISLSSDLTLTALYKEALSNKGGSGTINTGGSGGSRGGSRTSTVNIISNTHFWEGSYNRWRGRNIYDGSYITNSWKYMNYAGSSGWYYFGNDGYILSGWQTIDGQRYYFEKDDLLTFGMMYTGEKTVDGRKCRFKDNGIFEGYVN